MRLLATDPEEHIDDLKEETQKIFFAAEIALALWASCDTAALDELNHHCESTLPDGTEAHEVMQHMLIWIQNCSATSTTFPCTMSSCRALWSSTGGKLFETNIRRLVALSIFDELDKSFRESQTCDKIDW